MLIRIDTVTHRVFASVTTELTGGAVAEDSLEMEFNPQFDEVSMPLMEAALSASPTTLRNYLPAETVLALEAIRR